MLSGAGICHSLYSLPSLGLGLAKMKCKCIASGICWRVTAVSREIHMHTMFNGALCFIIGTWGLISAKHERHGNNIKPIITDNLLQSLLS